MNKAYLIAGGASVASLAVGAAGGYLIAKKRFDKELDLKIAVEVAKTKKYFSILLQQQATANKPESPADIPPKDEVEPEDVEEEETPAQRQAKAKIKAKADVALTNYQGYAKPDLSDVVKSNIFTDNGKKKSLPPKDPATGRFMPTSQAVPDSREQTPYIITEDEFLKNVPEHDQENLLYFKNDQTLIMIMDRETVEIAHVGEVNLTLFPPTVGDDPSIICVRNEGFGIDYEIQLTMESLTAYMGLGEDDEAVDMEAINAIAEDMVADDEEEAHTVNFGDRISETLNDTRHMYPHRD